VDRPDPLEDFAYRALGAGDSERIDAAMIEVLSAFASAGIDALVAACTKGMCYKGHNGLCYCPVTSGGGCETHGDSCGPFASTCCNGTCTGNHCVN
jgi:hypothetical protein